MTRDILLAALESLEAQRARIESQIAEVHRLLESALGEAETTRKHNISTDGRERIAQAQRKRWEEYRTKKSTAVLTKV